MLRPSIWGILMSTMARSGARRLMRSSPSTPLAALPTTMKPKSCQGTVNSSPFLIQSESSTIATLYISRPASLWES